jgi:3-dehydroquinate synthetase
MITGDSFAYTFNNRNCHVTIGFENLEGQLKSLNIPAHWSYVVCLHDSKIEAFTLNKLSHIIPLKFFPVKGGEEVKTPAVLFSTLETLLPHIDRKSLLIVVGGGTLGDMGGLCASLLMRGIDWVFIPSTLLAMVDSSIGGKTAINMDKGKNLVGTFHPPVQLPWGEGIIIRLCGTYKTRPFER